MRKTLQIGYGGGKKSWPIAMYIAKSEYLGSTWSCQRQISHKWGQSWSGDIKMTVRGTCGMDGESLHYAAESIDCIRVIHVCVL